MAPTHLISRDFILRVAKKIQIGKFQKGRIYAQYKRKNKPELCRDTAVTRAWITLALVSFSKPEHINLLPPSTDHIFPWDPAKDMAPIQSTK